MESLQGYFLIATPKMPDPRFHEQVVYICTHDDAGAMGLVVNRPLPDLTLADILLQFNLPVPSSPLPPVYYGGPVETSTAFILYSNEYTAPSSMTVSDTVSLSRDPAILDDISMGRGPASYLFLLGYAGWAPGQLEAELGLDGWLTLPGDDQVLFHPADEMKWRMAAQIFGIDIAVFGDVIGTA